MLVQDGAADLLVLEPATLAFASSSHRRFARQRKKWRREQRVGADAGEQRVRLPVLEVALERVLVQPALPSKPNFVSAGGPHGYRRRLTSRSPSDVSSVVAEMMSELRWSSSPLVRLLEIGRAHV